MRKILNIEIDETVLSQFAIRACSAAYKIIVDTAGQSLLFDRRLLPFGINGRCLLENVVYGITSQAIGIWVNSRRWS